MSAVWELGRSMEWTASPSCRDHLRKAVQKSGLPENYGSSHSGPCPEVGRVKFGAKKRSSPLWARGVPWAVQSGSGAEAGSSLVGGKCLWPCTGQSVGKVNDSPTLSAVVAFSLSEPFCPTPSYPPPWVLPLWHPTPVFYMHISWGFISQSRYTDGPQVCAQWSAAIAHNLDFKIQQDLNHLGSF